ncbi:MAG: sulfite exporter TauE/SafE family protein [Pseudomonadota bacterium]
MATLLDSLLVLIPVGALGGLVAGLFGIGGGIVAVVVLVTVLPDMMSADDRIMHVALGTSLAAIVMTSVASTLSHHCRGAVRWPIVLRFAPAVALGALAGGTVAHHLPDRALRIGLGVFLLWVAIRLWRRAAIRPSGRLPGAFGLAAVGGAIGVIASWTGIGGGSLSGPFLMGRGLPAAQSVGTSAAVGFPIAVAGAAGYIAGGWGASGLPPHVLGYVFWPAALVLGLASMLIAPFGARLAHALPEAKLKMAYAGLLVFSALNVMRGAF